MSNTMETHVWTVERHIYNTGQCICNTLISELTIIANSNGFVINT